VVLKVLENYHINVIRKTDFLGEWRKVDIEMRLGITSGSGLGKSVFED
jgi:hypothetical protein